MGNHPRRGVVLAVIAYEHEAHVLMLRVDGGASENWYC
ncbi:hypothetical protein Poly24_16340 [Rosistilla carotiformis]|uniref:Uncharacterized protein n=1 Tax=Rosistilla carotiformis TaxID=2528017 RepID=A0A518JQW5_9BACT|nr:hypothetical protein Poly24_16340 [Rosistilla carotiformis]